MPGCKCNDSPLEPGAPVNNIGSDNTDLGATAPSTPLDFGGLAGRNARGLQPSTRKVLVIPLCIERQFTSTSTTPRFYVVGPRYLAGVGPLVEDITAQGRGKDFSSQFNWKLVGEKSVDGEAFAAFTGGDLITTQAAAGSVVGTPHVTRTDYMLNLRFAVGVLNGSGANTETGNLTAYAALKSWT